MSRKTLNTLSDELDASTRGTLEAPAVVTIMQRDGYVPDNRDAAETAVFFRKEAE